MLDTIKKLLILQERDRQIALLQRELETIEPKRHSLKAEAHAVSEAAEATRQSVLHLESDRKRFELEVEGKQELVLRYSQQQYQTKKNEEYRALKKEIDNCRVQIARLEDQELEIMEKAEDAQNKAQEMARSAKVKREEADRQVAALAEREAGIKERLTGLLAGRKELAEKVDGSMLPLYERQRQSKGDRVLVAITNETCGGCHMKLPAQEVLSCRADQKVVTCPNCSRVLYLPEA